jgi:hypothetical protein
MSKNVKTKTRANKTTTLPAVLYGCETWSLTSQEEHILRVFEDRVLERILETTRDSLRRSLRKLNNDELHNSYCSPSTVRTIKSRMMIRAKHIAGMRHIKSAQKIYVGKPEENRPLGRPTRSW